jgi:hypothetical protein
MDFLNPSKKRAHNIRLIIGYILIAIAIGLVTSILVFQSYGYDLDRKTGAIIQNGLLVVSAQPEQADVYLNGKQYKSQSSAKLVLPSDVYQLVLSREGYRSWTHTVSLAGGSIERFVYPFLFPATMTAKQQKIYSSAPILSTQSPDRHWILVQPPGQLAVFDQFDAGDSKKAPTVVTVPPTLITAGTNHQFKAVEWSTDNKHFLLQHDYSGGREFIMVDRDTVANSFNVNKIFKMNPTEVTLRNKAFDQLYLYEADTHKLSIGDQRDSIVKPLLNDVLAFKSHGSDLILYTTEAAASPGNVRVMINDSNDSKGPYQLREIPAGNLYLLSLAQYSGHWFMAAGTASDNRVYVYKDPLDGLKKVSATPITTETVLRAANPGWIEFSANAQVIAIQGGSQVSTYDIENQHTYRYDVKLSLDAEAPNAAWMDGDRLLLNSDGKTNVVDYDGTNQQVLVPNKAGTVPMFDREYKLMYTVAPSATAAGGFDLSRYNLVVGQNN